MVEEQVRLLLRMLMEEEQLWPIEADLTCLYHELVTTGMEREGQLTGNTVTVICISSSGR